MGGKRSQFVPQDKTQDDEIFLQFLFALLFFKEIKKKEKRRGISKERSKKQKFEV